jgi:hypothetical protein
MMNIYSNFNQDDINSLNVELKIGILGTVTPAGYPHLTMISTLQPGSAKEVVWGQFTEGRSKVNIQQNPKAGFLMMTLDKEMWRGVATFRQTAIAGSEFDHYNNLPMFRYNAYFGVHTIYYMDLGAHHGKEILPMRRIIRAAIQTMLARFLGSKSKQVEVLNSWTRALLNKVDNLKFLGYINEAGFPVIFPVIQTQALDTEHVIFSTSAYSKEIANIPPGTTAALFGMSFDMEDVLLRGEYLGVQQVAGIPCGVVRADWVYNPMPPKPQQIYPPVKLQAVRKFT